MFIRATFELGDTVMRGKAIFLLVAVLLPVGPVFSSDLSGLQNECAQLGLRKGTPANGNCVLQLMRKAKENAATEQEKNQALLSQQAEIQRLRQQQNEMMELQRRAVAAQEQAANAQSRQSNAYQFNNAMQMLMGTGNYYKPQPRSPVTCTTLGNMTTCN